MKARLSFLLSCALFAACDRSDGDPPDPPQEQQTVQAVQRQQGPSGPGTAPARQTDAEQPRFAPTPATVVRETELKEQPLLDAPTIATLPERTAVTIVDRREGWFEVVHEETRGWVRLLHVSSQPPGADRAIPPELERAARVATGRAGEGNIVVTTGTRGLTVEELRDAEANPEELRRMQGLAADSAQAETYAREQGLERRDVPYPSATRGDAR